MKLYQKQEKKSRVTAESVFALVLPVLAILDLRAAPCFIGMVLGVEMAADKAVFAWLFAAQIIAAAVIAAVMAAKAVRRARAPRRYGVIPASVIRRALEVQK